MLNFYRAISVMNELTQMLRGRPVALSAMLLAVLTVCGCGLSIARIERPASSICQHVSNVRALAEVRLVFFGELHGTEESPAMIGEIACIVSRERPVVVALEWPNNLQAAVTKFLASTGGSLAVEELLRDPFWRTDMLDGKSSASMLRLIDRVRFLRSQGARIDISVFDDPVEALTQSTGRERRLADRLLNLVHVVSADTQILVLTGNLHSRVTHGVPWNRHFEPTAYLLRNLNPLAFELGHSGGTAWNCGRETCSARRFTRNLTEEFEIGTPSVILSAEVSNGHHGFFAVGSISASPPAVPPTALK
jgi:hypothetical protein